MRTIDRSTVRYTSRTGNPNHAAMVAIIHNAPTRPAPKVCPDTSVEPHELGEFPISCFTCYYAVTA